MRIVHTFTYNGGKSFQAWELTVGDYYLFLRDPEYATLKVLTEYNKKPPVLTKAQLEKFLAIYFDGKADPAQAIENRLKTAWNSKEKAEEHARDFHIQYCMVSRVISFDCKDMPMEIYKKVVQDLAIIIDPSKYDKDRHSKKPDTKAINKHLKNKQGVLYW